MSAARSQTVSTIVNDPTTLFRDALIFDANNNLYCADYGGNSVYKRTPNGNVSVFASGFSAPNGMAFDSNGNMFLCDNTGGAIYKINNSGNVVDTFPILLSSGIIKDIASDTMIFTVYSSSGGLLKLAPDGSILPFHSGAPLNGPVGLAYIGTDLYVGNFTNRKIYRVETDTLIYIATVPGSGSLGFIAAVGNSLYGTCFQTHKIYKIVPNEIDSTFLIAGSTNGSNDGPISSATFSQPNGIIANPAGDTLYISQYANGRLRMITGFTLGLEPEKKLISTLNTYPNPSTGKFTVQLFENEFNLIQVYNLAGELMMEIDQLSGSVHELFLPADLGVYLIKVSTSSRSACLRVVKSV